VDSGRKKATAGATIAFGGLNILVLTHEVLYKGAVSESYFPVLCIDLAFSIAAIVAGIGLFKEKAWAQAGTVAIWGAVFVDSVFWLWNLGTMAWTNQFYWKAFLFLVPRLFLYLLCVGGAPLGIWTLLKGPRRVPTPWMVAALIVAVLVCGGINGWIIVQERV
jgi:hypothetical protein